MRSAEARLLDAIKAFIADPDSNQKASFPGLPGFDDPASGNVVRFSARFSQTTTAATTRSDAVLPGNDKRSYLLIQNNSSLPVWIGFSQLAATNKGIKIDPGGNYEPDVVPTNDIYLFSTGNAPCTILEAS